MKDKSKTIDIAVGSVIIRIHFSLFVYMNRTAKNNLCSMFLIPYVPRIYPLIGH